MSVIPVSPDLVEVTTLLLQPSQSFSSSSSGLTGSIRLSSKPSNSILTLDVVASGSAYTETSGVTADSDVLYSASQAYLAGDTDISDLLDTYLTDVSSSSIDRVQFLTTSPTRFTSSNTVFEPTFNPSTGEANVPVDYNEWTNLQRNTIWKTLIPNQLVENPLSLYGYVNYHSLNFISSNNFSTSSGIVYPNFPNASGDRAYLPTESFTLDFFIKPKAQLNSGTPYHAGTVLHLSSSICVSLISGSSLSQDQKPETYRILLQLSQSADVTPSSINPSSLPLSFPNDLIFATDDVLTRDTWHRVTIRWGGSLRSNGSGSIKVDNTTKMFNANYTSISTKQANNALVLGNYYDTGDRIGKFFNSVASTRYGTVTDPIFGTADPNNYKFAHQLNAELHHISLFKRYLSDNDLNDINTIYPKSVNNGGPLFFVAPFFTSSVTAYNTYVTPSVTRSLSTDSPVSYHLAAGYNAYYLNLQNFLIEFQNKLQPRAVGMSESEIITATYDSRYDSIDNLLMSQSVNRRRNFTILPCDDGNFNPNFNILENDSTRFQDLSNGRNTMFLSLENLVPSRSYVIGRNFQDLSYDGSLSIQEDKILLPLYQNRNYLTRFIENTDNSSNLVTVFSIPAAYFLNRIVPGSFVLTDTNVSGSGGLSFTLKDDGRGNLYRADARSTHAKWNRVGAIFYPYGIAAILTPHLPYFGKNSYEMTFRGEVRKTVANFSIPASAGSANTSYNPTYKSFPPTNLRSEQADDFVYITGINLHDENLNVVMRAKLAQAVQKREGDEIVFRLRYDF